VLLDPHPLPPEDFNSLQLSVTERQLTYYRLNPSSYKSATYFDRSGRGRFDSKEASYSICYVGETIEVAFIECFGRQLGIKFVSQQFIRTRNLFLIESLRPFRVVDLFGAGLAQLGIDSRVTCGADYGVSRSWAEAIYHHPQQVDGIRYFSRHDNTRLCCGLFERVKDSLVETNLGNLVDLDLFKLAEILELYGFGTN
jgi:hypothetical protein